MRENVFREQQFEEQLDFVLRPLVLRGHQRSVS